MEIQNSLLIADYIRGAFIPIGVISVLCFVIFIGLLLAGVIEFEGDFRKLKWWMIYSGAELAFALWLFSTFRLV